MNEKDLMLLTDYYELTMAFAYFQEGKQKEIAYFDMFTRKAPDGGGYLVFNGLQRFIDFVVNFKFTEEQLAYIQKNNSFTEEFIAYLRNMKLNIDVWSLPEGAVAFPNEPLMCVRGNWIEAQIVETILLVSVNYATLIATKASRIAGAAKGRGVLEFGARRAQGAVAALEGARAAIIAGCIASSNTLAGFKYDIPVAGTMAHSYIQLYDDEYQAFLTFAKHQPHNCTFLVDTYDSLKSGVPNAIRVAKEYLEPKGYKLKAIRLDSGDLAYLAKNARKLLDAAGLSDVKIMVSNSLNEFLIEDLLNQGAPIDLFGVGENLITAASNPVLGGIYKVVAYEKDGKIVPTIKISDNVEKVTTPGYKKVYRFYDRENKAIADLIALADEVIPLEGYELFDPVSPWKRKYIKNYTVKALHQEIFVQGQLVYEAPSTLEVASYHKAELATLWDEVKRLRNPHNYYVDLSQQLFDMKNDLIAYHRAKNQEK